MTSVVWMAVSITVFMTPHSDGTTAMSIVPGQVFESAEDCDKWRLDQNSIKRTSYDEITDRAVAAYLFDCTPVTPDLMKEMLQNPV